MSPKLPRELRRLLDNEALRRAAESALHVTTMRLPARTIATIDENRGAMNRTEFIVYLVDQIESAALGAENERCADEKPCCERT